MIHSHSMCSLYYNLEDFYAVYLFIYTCIIHKTNLIVTLFYQNKKKIPTIDNIKCMNSKSPSLNKGRIKCYVQNQNKPITSYELCLIFKEFLIILFIFFNYHQYSTLRHFFNRSSSPEKAFNQYNSINISKVFNQIELDNELQLIF